jgi:hypothetical protein
MLFLVLFCNVTFAQSTTLFQDYVSSHEYVLRSEVTSKFYFDLSSGQGYADVNVQGILAYRGVYPHPSPRCEVTVCDGEVGTFPMPITVDTFRDRFEIEGLNVVNGQIVYTDAQREVNCGYIGRTRVLRRVQINLNGNCRLHSTYQDDLLTVKFTVK